jgi:hypothetical protein
MTVDNTRSHDTSDLNRRDFIFASAAAAAGLTHGSGTLAADKHSWSKIRGFNYQPSSGTSGLEVWRQFDAKTVELEIGRGKRHFPGMNTLRWWHSWEAFSRDPKRYAEKFEASLTISKKFGCMAIPVLFNRWHDAVLDFGGIYVDHFLPGSFSAGPGIFDRYLTDVVGPHINDPRILAWDLCNEPYWYRQDYVPPWINANVMAGLDKVAPLVAEAETAWLKRLYDQCKALGCVAPLTVGGWANLPLEAVNSISDILTIHPYWRHDQKMDKAAFEAMLDADMNYARKVGKPLIATECCWGDMNDAVRAESVRYTLEQLTRRGIGFTAHLLHHALVADAHRPEFGYVGAPGYMAFVEADGSLRLGHEVFNEF